MYFHVITWAIVFFNNYELNRPHTLSFIQISYFHIKINFNKSLISLLSIYNIYTYILVYI